MSAIVIRAGAGEGSDAVVRKFQKKIALENVVLEYRERQFHKTASEKRQERRAEKMRKIMRSRRQRD